MRFVLVHAFPPVQLGHGGNRRSHQILKSFELQGEIAASIVFVEPGWSTSPWRLLKLMLRGYIWQVRHRSFALDPKASVLVGAAADFVRRLIARRGSEFVLVWEGSTGCNWFLGAVAREYGLDVVALPQNLDSLVKGVKQPFLFRRKSWVALEMMLYARCNLVLGIAHEDVWLLRLHGVNAQWWPFVSETRDARKGLRPGGGMYCLSLGSAGNGPTVQGLRTLGLLFQRQLRNVNLKIVGLGTERLRGDPEFLGVECVGGVDDDQLADLVRNAACVVIHQPAATGALTRLVDLDGYDVPVLCSVDAYRSAHFLRNVRCYASSSELVGFVNQVMNGEHVGVRTDALDTARVQRLIEDSVKEGQDPSGQESIRGVRNGRVPGEVLLEP